MRVSLTEKVLEILQAGTEETMALLDVALSSYPDSYRKMRQHLRGGANPFRFSTDWAEYWRARKSFRTILARLKREGFITEGDGHDKKSHRWSLTKQGKKRLGYLKKRNQTAMPILDASRYGQIAVSRLTIVIFDIPEREKRKRRWLRDALKLLGFTLLQKSVWTAHAKLPKIFLIDLRDLDLLPYIHIFTVQESGTIIK